MNTVRSLSILEIWGRKELGMAVSGLTHPLFPPIYMSGNVSVGSWPT